MSSIDQRVVEMRFDNAQFERGIKSTLTSLAELNKGLKLDGASKGLQDVAAASKGFSLANIAAGIENIASKFKALSVIGIAALATLTQKAVDTGLQLAKSLTVEPILDGFREYELKLNAITAIMGNVAREGKSLKDVTAGLNELNEYSDRTIYNFGEMVNNIKAFTVAGVGFDDSVAAIKGLANVAAITGTNSEDAARGMYQLSQAMSVGVVRLQDWISIEKAGGMGGKLFQEELMNTARVHGIGIDEMIAKHGSFRASLSEEWLSTDVMLETLAKFTGDLTDAQLEAMGYTREQIVAIQEQAKAAVGAAQDVKTFTQLMSTLSEGVASGWAESFEIIFGDIEEAKKMWTGISTVVGGVLAQSSEARNNLLRGWDELGGRQAAIDAVANAFTALMSVLRPIKDAFRQIFPPVTAQTLYDITVAIRDFTAGLKMGGESAGRLQRTFAGFFAIFGIAKEVIQGALGMLGDLFGVVFEGSGSFLEVTARVGDFIVAVHEAITSGSGLSQFFEGLGNVLAVPIRFLKNLAALFGSLFVGFSLGAVEGIAGQFSPLVGLGDVILTIWEKVLGQLKNVGGAFAKLPSVFGEAFGGLGGFFSEAVKNISFEGVIDVFTTGLVAAVLLALRDFIKSLQETAEGFSGVLETITSPFSELTNTLKAMQNTLRAATLLQIAAAVGILTLAVVSLSKVDEAGLKRALGAMTVLFVQLTAAMAIFQKIDIASGMVQMIALAIAINILATAVRKMGELNFVDLMQGLYGVGVALAALVIAARTMPDGKRMISSSIGLIILSAAVKVLADAVSDLAGLSWEDMAKGLVGVGALLASLLIFTRLTEANKGGIASAVGLILLATGVKILASAVTDFAQLSWEEIARGLVAMGGGLTIMAAALKLIPPSSVFSAAAVLAVAASLGMIADALETMGGTSWSAVGQGLTAMAGALGLIAVALNLLPPSTLLSAAAIFIVASSLGMIANALGQMGGMSWEEIAKGLITLAGSLVIIAAAMYLMTGAIAGAAATVVVAGALAILAPILLLFGNMSWEEIAKGMVVLAGAFAIFGVAGLLLTPVIPTLLGLAIAIGIMGVGMLAAGAGMLAFATGLTAIAVAGAAGATAIVAIVSSLVGLIPMVMTQIGLGIVAFAKVIATASPAMMQAMTAVLNAILDTIIRLSPKIIATLTRLLVLLLKALANSVPQMVSAGLRLVTGILNGIAKNIGGVVTAATNVIVAFLKGIGQNQPRIIQAGVQLIISFINGLANAIRGNSAAMGAAGANLATAIVSGMARGLAAGIGVVTRKAREVAQGALNAAKRALGISSPSKEFALIGQFADEGLAFGLGKFSNVVSTAAEGVGQEAIFALQKSISGMSELVSGDVELHPKITPILDLTNVKKGAAELVPIFASRPISVTATYDQATAASASYARTHEALATAGATSEITENITFVQNNNSPKALTAAEIYRQTRNQLSIAKGALTP